jgi:hypothetical protein
MPLRFHGTGQESLLVRPTGVLNLDFLTADDADKTDERGLFLKHQRHPRNQRLEFFGFFGILKS